MTPFTAQGATQTLEDAGALLSVFSNLNSKGDLPKRMQAYDKVRITRTRRIQSSSSTALRSGKPNPLVERKQEYEDEDKMLPKNMGGVMDKARFEKEKFLWDFKYVFHLLHLVGWNEEIGGLMCTDMMFSSIRRR